MPEIDDYPQLLGISAKQAGSQERLLVFYSRAVSMAARVHDDHRVLRVFQLDPMNSLRDNSSFYVKVYEDSYLLPFLGPVCR